MSDYPEYYFLPDETVGEGIKRIAGGLIDKTISDIDDPEMNIHDTVHEVRKRCKEIRGLIRITRPSFEDVYKKENAWYRDAAKELSHVRDSQSIIESFDALLERFKEVDSDEFRMIREKFVERRDDIAEERGNLEKLIANFRHRMEEGRSRVEFWSLNHDEFNAIEAGFKKTYRRGRKAISKAYDSPSAENFHQWRKRVKYHWYHIRLLTLTWEKILSDMEKEVHLLSDYLGDDHDLAILKSTMLADPAAYADIETIYNFIYLIDKRSLELRHKAKFPGEKIYGDKPKWKGHRFRVYWEAWKRKNRAVID